MHTKHQVLVDNLSRYLQASKRTKTKLLDEWTVLLGMHRKSIIRYLRKQQMKLPGTMCERRGPKKRYGPAVTIALREIWETSAELCAERLHPKTPYQRVLEHPGVTAEAKAKLTTLYQTLNPLLLKQQIDTLVRKIFTRPLR